jgi:putative spermidine/putrescine transport system substrate-binding protein
VNFHKQKEMFVMNTLDPDPKQKPFSVTRRDLLALGATTAGLVSLSALGTLAESRMAVAATGTLNLTSWGGAYQMSQINAYEKPYTEATGIVFNNIEKSANGPALVTAQEQSGNISWDIVDMLQSPGFRLFDQGLLQEIDFDKDLAPAPDGTPASQDFVEGSLSGDGKTGGYVSTISYSTLFAYDKSAFGKEAGPKTIKDVFDVANFPGMRALQKIPAGNLEWALYADGVEIQQIYDVLKTPDGVSRAFEKLNTLKPHAIWWSQGAQPPQMLAQKQATIASAYNGRIFNAIVADNQPFDFVWDGGLYEWDGWVIPANLPKDRLEQAMKFLRFSTTTKSLVDQARYIAYSPARKSSFQQMANLTYFKDPKIHMMPYMPTSPEHLKVAIPKSVSFWSNYGPELDQRFSAWLSTS